MVSSTALFARRIATAGGLLPFIVVFARAQSVRVRPGEYPVVPGFSITVPIEVEASEQVTGFSFGVSHDDSKLRLVSVTPGADLLAAMGLTGGADPSGDFFLVDQEPLGGAGFTVAAILGPRDPEAFLAAGTHVLFEVEYQALGGVSGEAAVTITDQLGVPPVDLVVDVKGGTPRSFAPSAGSVTLGAPFKRGDTNGDGRFNIADAMTVLFYLFRGGEIGLCPTALNVDGSTRAAGGDPLTEDRQDIQITDAIQLLRYLFASGVEPATPFPACGQPTFPSSQEMVCRSYDGCP